MMVKIGYPGLLLWTHYAIKIFLPSYNPKLNWPFWPFKKLAKVQAKFNNFH